MRINQRELQRMVARIPRNIQRKEAPDLEIQIKAIKDELLAGIATSGDKTSEKMAKMQTQLDALDGLIATRHHTDSTAQHKSMGERVLADEGFLAHKAQNFRGRESVRVLLESAFSRKTNITDSGLGDATSGVVQIQRLPGVVGIPKQGFRLRDLIEAIPQLSGHSFDYVTQSVRTNAASPQVEAAAKAESTYMWNTATDKIRTIAHFTNVSRQALDDNTWLRSTIDGELTYGLQLKEEAEILAGAGTGEHLNGLITQATAYASGTYNVTGDTNLDILRSAKLQARLAGLATFAPSAYVLHPIDMARIEKIKTAQSGANTGVYILGNPGSGGGLKFIWDLPVVESDTITPGSFLVGAFDTGVKLIDRMTTTIDISFEHNTNFTQNLATILCEERVGLAVKRPGAFIYGSLPNGLV